MGSSPTPRTKLRRSGLREIGTLTGLKIRDFVGSSPTCGTILEENVISDAKFAFSARIRAKTKTIGDRIASFAF